MKNREKYKDEVVEAVKDPRRGSGFMKEYVYPFYGVCGTATAFADSVLLALWLDEEYVEPVTDWEKPKIEEQNSIYEDDICHYTIVDPETDWSKVEVDTPILVKGSDEYEWEKRHFAKFEDKKVFAYDFGTTSWSHDGWDNVSCWEYAKLPGGIK